jgi:hypothetical protein
MTTTLRAQARITVDGWTVEVEHVGQYRDAFTGSTRNRWMWTITGPTSTDDPYILDNLVRSWTGDDLSSAIDVNDPDPIAALCSLGSFLGAYAEAIEWQYRTGLPSDNAGLFPATLPADVASEIADRILVEFPEDPESRPCEGCLAEPGEPCRPGCLSQVEDCDHLLKDYQHVYLPDGSIECGRCGADIGEV